MLKTQDDIVRAVRAALEHEPQINLHRHPVHLAFEDSVLTMESEVEHIAAKKLALELAAAVPGVSGIVDRLRVKPATHMGDGAILDAVRDALLQEPALQNCNLVLREKGAETIVRDAGAARRGNLIASVEDGVVLLDDHVVNLAQKRLAGVLAWWVPGSRDVVNGLAVEPPDEDNDNEITDAVRLVLEKDRLVNADNIRVTSKNAVVTLEGIVPSDPHRHMAEFDAWYVFGVDRVINRLEVRP